MADTSAMLQEQARQYAFEVHASQSWAGHPYTEHLRRVHALCQELELGTEICTAAWLHDCLEDSDKAVSEHIQELQERFGLAVVELVFAVSGFGSRRTERCLDIVGKLWKIVRQSEISDFPTGVAAVNLKMADRWVNWHMSQQGIDTLSGKLCKLYLLEFQEHYRALLPYAHPELQRRLLELEKAQSFS